MADSSGPFDYHLSRQLISLGQEHDIRCGRDVFRYYRCDSASAVEAGNDIRAALISFGVDASHGYERTHMDSLERSARLVIAYAKSAPLFAQQAPLVSSLEDFPTTRETPVPNLLSTQDTVHLQENPIPKPKSRKKSSGD